MYAVSLDSTLARRVQTNLDRSSERLGGAVRQLSSGLRLNSAKDDAAGAAIAEKMTSRVRGFDQARRNANDAVSLMQTAESGVSQIANILQRVRELAVQSVNSTNNMSDRQALSGEAGQLLAEMDRLAVATEFNGKKVLDGSLAATVFQVGSDALQTVTATNRSLRTSDYGQYVLGGSSKSHTHFKVAQNTQAWGAVHFAIANISVSGVAGTASFTAGEQVSVKDLAERVNARSGQTGVAARARTETLMTFSGATGVQNLKVFKSNEAGNESTQLQTISFDLKAFTGADALGSVVDAFNAVKDKTGVEASLSADQAGVVLVAEDGANLNIGREVASNTVIRMGDDIDRLDAGTTGTLTGVGQLSWFSDSAFSVGLSTGTLVPGVINDNYNSNTSFGSALSSVGALDLSTAASASKAIGVIDASLHTLDRERSSYGAMQNRMAATVGNLSSGSENLSAARSRIRDADYGVAVSAMTSSQIAQQAGIAMLAQASNQPQQVLTLLRSWM